MKHPCPSRCGRFSTDSTYTLDQCRPCWIAHHDPTWRIALAKSGAETASDNPPWRADRCVHLGDRIEFRSRCRTGMRCQHDCRKQKVAVPGVSCQTCTLYSPHKRANPVNAVPWVGDDWEDYVDSNPASVSVAPLPIEFKTCDVRNPRKDVNPTLVWQYGVTTVPTRRNGEFLRTCQSLVKAGFDSPHLFIDGDADGLSWIKQVRDEHGLRFPSITLRERNVRTAGNWVLSLYELWCRNPHADRYAIFQDDFVTYPHLREYLESCPYPADGYWNLYTFHWNEPAALRAKGRNLSAVPDDHQGWYQADQRGTGAVALVFDHSTARQLLSSSYLVDRFMDKQRGHRAIDGGIVSALKEVGRREYVHSPSLVQHTGDKSSMGNGRHSKAITFKGEGFDARTMTKS